MKRNRAIITACAEKLTFAFQTPRRAGDPLKARRLKSGVSDNRERPRFDRACASCEYSGGRRPHLIDCEFFSDTRENNSVVQCGFSKHTQYSAMTSAGVGRTKYESRVR
jgi:hypothetical protein